MYIHPMLTGVLSQFSMTNYFTIGIRHGKKKKGGKKEREKEKAVNKERQIL